MLPGPSAQTGRSGQGSASFLSFIHCIPFFRPPFSSSAALVRPVKLCFYAGIKVESAVGGWIIKKKKKKKLGSESEMPTNVGRRVLIVKRLAAGEGLNLLWWF